MKDYEYKKYKNAKKYRYSANTDIVEAVFIGIVIAALCLPLMGGA